RWVIRESACLRSFSHRERGMPGPRLPMRKIRDVLRLSAAGMSKRQIAASLGVSATAAGDCIRRARRAGLTWLLPDGLTDEALELLWEEHRAVHPDGYGYSRFCERYRSWEARLSPTMRQ